MKRTKYSSTINHIYNVNEEPIVLSKPLLDKLLKDINPAEVIGLYCFYYYTAKWQKTNQPKATTEYTASALNWNVIKVRAVKKRLKDLGLVEDIQEINPINNTIAGHFIRVNFIWSQTRVHPERNPDGGSIQTVDNLRGNALSSDRLNALSSNNKNSFSEKHSPTLKERNESYLPIANKLYDIIRSVKNVNHDLGHLRKWANSIRQIIETDGISLKRIEEALEWYSDNIGGEYIPEIESGQSLREKFVRLEAAMKRASSSQSNNKRPDYIIRDGRKYYRQKNGFYMNKDGDELMN